MSSMLHYLAVGRFKTPEDYHIICSAVNPGNSSEAKTYKNHMKAILKKGGTKLANGKRIRLTSDENDYELHVLADDPLNQDTEDMGSSSSHQSTKSTNSYRLVFFLVTSMEFSTHHSLVSVFREFKSSFYNTFNSQEYLSPNASFSSLNKVCQTFLQRLLTLWNTSRLNEAQMKVENVKEQMKMNVEKALNNVEHLEELETKSEQFEEQAKQFSKNAHKVKQLFRCRYYKVTMLIVCICLAVLGYIIYAIYKAAN